MPYIDSAFSNLPTEWTLKPLGEVADILDNKRAPLNSFERATKKGAYPYCGANGIVDYIDEYRFDGEHVLIAEDGGYWGRNESSSYIMRGKFWVNNHAHVIAAKDGLTNNVFLSNVINYMNISPLIGGDARGKLTKSILVTLLVPMAPLPEQCRIAKVLSTAQTAIEQQVRLIVLARELKSALMSKLFAEGLRGEKQKGTEIGLVPKSWEVVPLREVAGDGFQNGAFIKNPVLGKGVLFANVVDMYREVYLDFTQLERIDVEVTKIKRYLLEEHDVLVVRSSLKREGIGQNCVVRELKEPVFYDCHLIRVKPDTTRIVPEFLSYFWRSDKGKQDLIQRSKTTTMTTINQAGLAGALMPLPSYDEQSDIANVLLSIDTKIQLHRQKQKEVQELFRALLHQLMTGKTRVNEIDLPGIS
jgi:type I restriction enzyme S subunit